MELDPPWSEGDPPRENILDLRMSNNEPAVSTCITITRPYNILRYVTAVKMFYFQMTNCDIFLMFAQNIDRGLPNEAVLTSIHNLCFRAKVRK